MNRHIIRHRSVGIGVSVLCVFVAVEYSGVSDATELGLTAETVRELVLSQNRHIRAAVQRADASRMAVKIASGVYDTRLEMSANYMREREPQNPVFTGNDTEIIDYGIAIKKYFPSGTAVDVELRATTTDSFTDGAFTNGSIPGLVYIDPACRVESSLIVSQPLLRDWLGRQSRGNIKIARLEADRAKFIRDDTTEVILHQALVNYWRWRSAANFSEIAKQSLLAAKRLESTTRDKLRYGRAEKVDVIAAVATRQQRELQLMQAVDAEQTLFTNLKSLLFLDEDLTVTSRESMESLVEPRPLSTYLDQIENGRRDLVLIRKELELLGIKQQLAADRRLAQLNLAGGLTAYGLDKDFGQSADRSFSGESVSWFGGVTLTLPLENRAALGETQQLILLVDEAKTRRDALIHQVSSDIRRNHEHWIQTRQIAKQSNRVVEELTNRVEAEGTRFRQGRSDSANLIRYDEELLQAQWGLSERLLDVRLAELTLMRDLNALFIGEPTR